jgi:hypothetical protein
MPQISTQEFERLPLRVHAFLAGVPLHDVWVVDLPRARSGITLDEFLRTARECLLTTSPVVRALLNIRLFGGRLLGWDREPAATAWETFTTRLTTADRSKSLVLAGTREGLFRVVYRFESPRVKCSVRQNCLRDFQSAMNLSTRKKRTRVTLRAGSFREEISDVAAGREISDWSEGGRVRAPPS